MITVTVRNCYTQLEGLDLKLLRKLDELCAYKVAGAHFSAAFKAHRWDGKKHLLRFSKKKGYHIPTGLLPDVVRALRASGAHYRVDDQTIVRHERRQLEWNDEIELRGYQLEAVEAMVRGKPFHGHGVLKAPPRAGKAQPVSEPVLTPKGWRPIGDLKPGDQVIGSEGKPITVRGVYPQGMKPTLQVLFSDGSWTRSTKDHLWTFDERNGSGKWNRTTMTLSEWMKRPTRRNDHNVIRVPLVSPVQHKSKKLPIEPYTLGVILGDGSITNGSPRVACPDKQVIDNMILPDGVEIRPIRQNHDRCPDYIITTGRTGGDKNPVTEALRKMQLWGKRSGGKFLPEEYKLASKAQRLALLQGLLDTDGSPMKGWRVEYSTSSPRLSEDVKELVESLGGTARVVTRRTKHLPSFRMYIRLPDDLPPFRLDRKLSKLNAPSFCNARTLDKIYPDIDEQCVCIEVDAEDGLYVTRGHILTHNTTIAARIIWEMGLPTMFVVTSKWLLHQAYESLKERLPGTPIGMIGDGVYKPRFITVASIQTLSRLSGNQKGVEKDKRWDELAQRFDVVIPDELHHFKGSGSWHEVLFDLDARYKMGLSATVFFDNKREMETGVIALKGSCGDIKYEVSVSRLVEEGFLLRQNVRMYRVTKPDLNGARWSRTLVEKCITKNKYRNRLIAKLAKKHSDKKGIIIAREIAHINAICEELDELGVEFRTVTGRDTQHTRNERVEGLIDGEYSFLVGNVMGEGVDIPEVDLVINADGGKDKKVVIQRQRNITVLEGAKKKPLLIDFFDETSKFFRKHSQARYDVYAEEELNRVRIVL